MTKFVTSLFVFFLLSTSLQAQEMETLFSKGITIGGFGGPLVGFSSVDGEFGVSAGGGGGVIINQSFFLGGYGMGLATIHQRPDVYHNGYDPIQEPFTSPMHNHLALNFGHGGLWIGYWNKPNQLFHWGISSKLGAGGISLYDTEFSFDEYAEVGKDVVYVINPQIEAEINMTSWFKISMALGYRYVGGISDNTYTNKDGLELEFYSPSEFNSPTVQLGFLFGKFRGK